MNLNPVILSIPLYFLLIGIELIIDRFSQKKLYRLNDAVTNISCGITQQLTGLFLKILSLGVYQYIFENFAFFQLEQTWWYWVALFIGADFLYYWAHRKSHEINLFWGGHVVHHQSEDYNLSVALRQSTFQVVWTFVFYIPLALLGFKTLDFVMIMGLNLIYQFWIHTETIGKMGWFEILFNTPSHHRVHHGRNPKYIDRNHAGVFIIWDKMFGTFQKEEERPTYGITKPVKSWNPVWVNVEHYVEMWKDLKLIKGFKNQLNYIFNKPGWLPQEMGGYQTAPEINKSNKAKYVTNSSTGLNWYVLFQYLLALAGTGYFLFLQNEFDIVEKSIIAFAIIFSITMGGLLFEGKVWSKYVELMRIVVIGSYGIYISLTDDVNLLIMAASITFILSSIIWLSKITITHSTLKTSTT